MYRVQYPTSPELLECFVKLPSKKASCKAGDTTGDAINQIGRETIGSGTLVPLYCTIMTRGFTVWTVWGHRRLHGASASTA